MKKNKSPQSLMMSHGYNASWSDGAVKPPLFLTSTFAFETAEDGKHFFEAAYGLREMEEDEIMGLIYSRLNNPNLEILEDRLSLWDEADACAVFESGMSAISTVLLEFLKPGDVLLYSNPVYGGTDHFIEYFLPSIGVRSIPFSSKDTYEEIMERVEQELGDGRLALVYAETPSNPNNQLIDIELCRKVADHFSTEEMYVPVAIDNTYMGPLWCQPLKHGADLVLYSATKYINGHSDVIAGAVSGKKEQMVRVRTLRTFLGNMTSPHTAWLLTRSLETLKLRMECQAKNAEQIADFLVNHEKVSKVYYLGLMHENDRDYDLYKKQYSSPGAMISFDIEGGEAEAFKFLNNLSLFKLAVSLGSTESLAQHPASMTHAGVDPDKRVKFGVTSSLVRLSIGIEHVDDLIQDLKDALDKV